MYHYGKENVLGESLKPRMGRPMILMQTFFD